MLQSIRVKCLRRLMKSYIALSWRSRFEPSVTITNRSIPGPQGEIKLRVYSPEGSGPFPVIIYFHGGGFVLGDLDSHAGLCAQLSAQSSSVVVAVDYRLAPEHPFPAAPEDCLAATEWVLTNRESLNGLSDSLVLSGDSAGGNLAAVTASRMVERHPGAIKGQVLIYPVIAHYSKVADSGHGKKGTRWFGKKTVVRMWNTYFQDSPVLEPGETDHPLAHPMLADHLDRLPPTLIITAGIDPLCDEGTAYARKLTSLGVSVQHSHYENCIHGFIGTTPSEDHHLGVGKICDWLQKLNNNGRTIIPANVF
ncbi:MAG: alpha/beta hydrolase [Endozoicomonas sp.]